MSSIPEGLAAALSRSYRLERELGAGGMATVYLAEDLKHRRQVAVKVLRPELVASIGADRFLREIEVTAHLQHPHILALYDSGQADGFLYYVMPYVPGDSLRARLQQEGQLPVADALRITRGVAAALGHAHQHGIVHRDIKPENILLAGGEPVVADFGIARALVEASGSALTSTGLTIGTPTYMSPEQASAAKLDGRSDLYSLGCVLYEMLAGEPPYLGATAQVITARKLQEPMPSLRVVRSSVPAGVEEVVRRTLAIAPADRYATAEELIGALDRAVSGPQGATGLTAARSTRTTRTLWAWRTATIALVAVSLWLAVRGQRASGRDAEPADRSVRFSIPLPPRPEGQAPDSERSYNELAISPDGRRIALTVIGRAGAPAEPIYLRETGSEEVRAIRGTEGGSSPFFSPDGATLGFYLPSERAIKRIQLAGGSPELVCTCSGFGTRMTWLPGDTVVFFSGELYALAAVPASGGVPRTLVAMSDTVIGQDVRDEAVESPDRRFLLFTRWNSKTLSSIWIRNNRSGELRKLIDRAQTAVFIGPDLIGYSGLRDLWGPELAPMHVVSFDPTEGRLRGTPTMVTGLGSQQTRFAVSGRGDLVVLDHQGERSIPGPTLAEVSQSGRVIRTIELRDASDLSLSPDGRSVVSTMGTAGSPASEVWVTDLLTTSATRLTNTRTFSAWPVWSSDGSRVAYSRLNRGERGGQLYLVPADGSAEPRQLTHMDVPHVNVESWAPDGRTLVIQTPENSESSTKADLFTLDVDGDLTPKPLLVTPNNEVQGAVSPDGRWLAYASDQSGTMEVYVQPFQRRGGAVKISSRGGWEPLWRPGGTELFYRSMDGRQVWMADLSTGTAGAPRLLFEGPFLGNVFPHGRIYGVFPDGHLLLPLPIPKPVSRTATVVMGWGSEVAKKLAAGQTTKP